MNRQKAEEKGIGRRHRQKAKKCAGQRNRQDKATGRARKRKGKPARQGKEIRH